MKTTLILTLMGAVVAFAADQPTRIELPKSGSVILTSSVEKNATQYVLSLKTSTEIVVNLASHEVPLLDKPPTEWRALLSCDENSDMVVALLEVNEFSLMLIQYDLAAKVAKEHHIAAARLLGDMRANGGSLRVNAPNRITLSVPNHEPRSWSAIDGKLIGDGSVVLEQGQTLQIGYQTSDTTPRTLPVGNVPSTMLKENPAASAPNIQPEAKSGSTQSEEPTSSTPWSIVVVLIIVAIALLWLLFKARK